MATVTEHKQHVFRGLGSVVPQLRCVFAAAAAERLFPYFLKVNREAKRGSAETVRESLDRVWGWAVDGDPDQIAIKRLIKDCKANIFEDGLKHPWAFAADDAAAAVAYAVMSAGSHSAEMAGWAGMRALDSLREHLIRLLFPSKRTLTPDDNEEIRSHPLFAAEIARQLADLNDLQGANTERAKTLVSRLRERAHRDSGTMFASEQSP